MLFRELLFANIVPFPYNNLYYPKRSLKTKQPCMKNYYHYAFTGRVKTTALFVLILTAINLPVLSQSRTTISVSGSVSLGPGAPDPAGTTVSVKGSSTAVITDSRGRFTISAPASGTLVFSHVGFQNIERAVNNQSEINITLDVTANNLDQVVVVSYGTRRQREITGAVATVPASAVKDLPASEFGQRLQGKLAG